MRMRVRTDSSFSRRAISVLEKLTGWPPGNLDIKRKARCIETRSIRFGGSVQTDPLQGGAMRCVLFQLKGGTWRYLLLSM
jgi:hypothetical protein